MTTEEFKIKMYKALVIEITPKIKHLPHVKDGEVFKVIKEISSIEIIDFKAPEFDLFKPHILLEFSFKVALDFVYFVGGKKGMRSQQQVSKSQETFGSCRYLSEQERFNFECERVKF